MAFAISDLRKIIALSPSALFFPSQPLVSKPENKQFKKQVYLVKLSQKNVH
jgi:hypothetical protein